MPVKKALLIGDVAKRLLQLTDSSQLGGMIAQFFDYKAVSKDLVQALTVKAGKQKDVIVEAMAKEFSNFLDKLNVAEEAQKVMDGMSINIEATISFKDRDIKPTKVKVSSSTKEKSPKTKKSSNTKKIPKKRTTKTKKKR